MDGFLQWLLEQARRSDDVGHLARETRIARSSGLRFTTKKTFLKTVEAHGSPPVVASAHAAVHEYETMRLTDLLKATAVARESDSLPALPPEDAGLPTLPPLPRLD